MIFTILKTKTRPITSDHAPPLRSYSYNNLLNILLDGSEGFSVIAKKKILKSKIKFLKASKSFDVPLY